MPRPGMVRGAEVMEGSRARGPMPGRIIRMVVEAVMMVIGVKTEIKRRPEIWPRPAVVVPRTVVIRVVRGVAVVVSGVGIGVVRIIGGWRPGRIRGRRSRVWSGAALGLAELGLRL